MVFSTFVLISSKMTMISELREAREKERQNAIAQATKSEAANRALIKQQTKMVAEIQKLNLTIEKLENEKKSIKMVQDMKTMAKS